MQVLVAGNVISFPGSGFVWHFLHSNPKARCFLWLYGMGCPGGVCSEGLSGTICFAACTEAACCTPRLAARKRNAANVEAIATGATHPVLCAISCPRKGP